jgi:lysophospholipase L1-like esterase
LSSVPGNDERTASVTVLVANPSMPPLASRLAALSLGLLAGCLVCEALTRVLDLAPDTVVVTADAGAFSHVPGAYLPLQRRTGTGRELRFDVQINSLGYRGAEPPPTDHGDALRIVFVGDSFVFGDFVADGQTWPAQLQALFTCPTPVVVYNAGVAGGTLTESIPMAERARVLRPDLVVGEFTAENDLRDMMGPSLWSRMETRRHVGPVVDTALRLLNHSALWNAVRQARDRIRTRASQRDLEAAPARLAQAQEKYAQLLAAWAAQLRSANIPLVFAVYPGYPALAEHDRSLDDWAMQAAARAGLHPVDLWPALFRDGRSPDELYLVPHDRHPSAKGYAAVARPVAEAILAQVAAFKDCRIAASP